MNIKPVSSFCLWLRRTTASSRWRVARKAPRRNQNCSIIFPCGTRIIFSLSLSFSLTSLLGMPPRRRRRRTALPPSWAIKITGRPSRTPGTSREPERCCSYILCERERGRYPGWRSPPCRAHDLNPPLPLQSSCELLISLSLSLSSRFLPFCCCGAEVLSPPWRGFVLRDDYRSVSFDWGVNLLPSLIAN